MSLSPSCSLSHFLYLYLLRIHSLLTFNFFLISFRSHIHIVSSPMLFPFLILRFPPYVSLKATFTFSHTRSLSTLSLNTLSFSRPLTLPPISFSQTYTHSLPHSFSLPVSASDFLSREQSLSLPICFSRKHSYSISH